MKSHLLVSLTILVLQLAQISICVVVTFLSSLHFYRLLNDRRTRLTHLQDYMGEAAICSEWAYE